MVKLVLESIENIVGKGENEQFLVFLTMFSTLSNTEIIIETLLIWSSANALNCGQSIILLYNNKQNTQKSVA